MFLLPTKLRSLFMLHQDGSIRFEGVESMRSMVVYVVRSTNLQYHLEFFRK